MSSQEIKTHAAMLMAARIQAVRGRPLTQDEVDLCYLEAALLNNRANELASGLGLGNRHEQLWTSTAARVESQMLHNKLSELPLPNEEPSPRPRL